MADRHEQWRAAGAGVDERANRLTVFHQRRASASLATPVRVAADQAAVGAHRFSPPAASTGPTHGRDGYLLAQHAAA